MPENVKGVDHASCKEQGGCQACGCCYHGASLAIVEAKQRLIDAGIPVPVADVCSWLSEPMFRHEYPNADLDRLIVDPANEYEQKYYRGLGWDYDIWIGMGYESANSNSACKMHFEIDADTWELTWCNVSEWAEWDDRWRGVCHFYDKSSPDQPTLKRLYQDIDTYFAS